jgi:hypothetical protein
MQGSVVPDPTNPHRVIAEYGDASHAGWSVARATAFVGNLAGEPAATMTVGTGLGWANSWSLEFLTSAITGPAMFVRWSGRPDTTDTPGGPMLTYGIERAIEPGAYLTFTSPELGGAATDPYTVYHQWRTGDGRWSTVIETPLQVDQVAPTVSAPTGWITTGSARSTVPYHVEWPAAADDEAGLRQVIVFRSDGALGDGLTAKLDPTVTSHDIGVHDGIPTAIVIGAVDLAGNGASAWGPRFTAHAIRIKSSAVRFSAGWTKVLSPKYSFGTAQYATKAGAKAIYTFTGRSVGFVTTKGPTRGKAEIWVDGSLAATVDLYRSSTAYRQLVWATHWDTPGQHKVVIKVLGTKHRPRVDVDVLYRI